MGKRNTIMTGLCMVATLFSLVASADVSLPKVIGDNMVLQRHRPVAIWGLATPGEKVTVTFGKHSSRVVADTAGKWLVHLPAMKASAKPADMVIRGNNTITLHNILVGEVWLCSGQSNMEFTMTKSARFANAKRSKGLDSAQTKDERNPNIRLFLVKRDLTKPDGGGVNKGWNEAAGAALGAFSAAGYYFAKQLYNELQVPIGMMASSVSGSNIEPWMNGKIIRDTTESPRHTHTEWRMDEQQPGKFYTGMIEPLAPYTLKGFLWYQGETNCFLQETGEYTYKFDHLVNSWRNLWNNADAPFYFVQIAPFHYSKSKGNEGLKEWTLPAFREAQASALKLPNTGMIITTDLVDNLDDIHPTYKWEIGERLALLALANDYKKPVEASGPLMSNIQVTDSTIIISFTHAQGLQSADNKPLTWFAVAGKDGNFVAAQAAIKNNKVVVSAPGIAAPRYVRFGWHEAAQPNLVNQAGLPAAPFRNDTFEK